MISKWTLQRGRMVIEPVSDQAVYITINGWVYYIDDGTGEQIMEKWKEE